jgi:C-terminal processing protease CtpA/Prc
MPAFNLLDSDLDLMTNRFRNHKALILDLRGNGGGYEVTLQRLLGFFFERDVQIGEIKRRDETKPLVAKARKLPGELDNHDSRPTAAELFAGGATGKARNSNRRSNCGRL